MQDALTRAQYYRDQAQNLRDMAKSGCNTWTRDALLVLADQYERICHDLVAKVTSGGKS